MAIFTVLERLRIDPGTYTSPAIPLSKFSKFKARIDALSTEWNDPSILITLVIEKSEDSGQTWRAWFTVNMVGGSYRKDGSLPGIELYDLAPDVADKTMVRCVFSINKKVKIGLVGETG